MILKVMLYKYASHEITFKNTHLHPNNLVNVGDNLGTIGSSCHRDCLLVNKYLLC